VVVHLGGIDRSVATDDAATMQVNALGTWNLFEASRLAGVRRVVHCSSGSVTGIDQSNPTMPPHYLPLDEAHALRPTDAYGLSKLCGERIAEAYARRGLEVVVLRPCFVAFPELVDFMAGRTGPADRAEPMPYLRAYVGPEDCAQAFAAAAALPDYTGYETFFLPTPPPPPACRRCRVAAPGGATRHCTPMRRRPRRSATPTRGRAWAGGRPRAGPAAASSPRPPRRRHPHPETLPFSLVFARPLRAPPPRRQDWPKKGLAAREQVGSGNCRSQRPSRTTVLRPWQTLGGERQSRTFVS
jgi:hypothetical protein